MARISDESALAFLRSVERGEVTVEAVTDPVDYGCTSFVASNGWTVDVFYRGCIWKFWQLIKDGEGNALDWCDVAGENDLKNFGCGVVGSSDPFDEAAEARFVVAKAAGRDVRWW